MVQKCPTPVICLWSRTHYWMMVKVACQVLVITMFSFILHLHAFILPKVGFSPTFMIRTPAIMTEKQSTNTSNKRESPATCFSFPPTENISDNLVFQLKSRSRNTLQKYQQKQI